MEGDRHPARLAVTEAREQVLEQLSDAFAKDELGLDEFEARIDHAYQATTEVGLRALVKDLSSPAPVASTALAHAHLLRDLVKNIETGTDSTTTFWGTERTLRFVSWCADEAAQRQRCNVRLAIDTVLTAVTSIDSFVVLMHATDGGYFRSLGDARHGGHWYRSWGPGITVALALGVIAGADTNVLRIGDRE